MPLQRESQEKAGVSDEVQFFEQLGYGESVQGVEAPVIVAATRPRTGEQAISPRHALQWRANRRSFPG